MFVNPYGTEFMVMNDRNRVNDESDFTSHQDEWLNGSEYSSLKGKAVVCLLYIIWCYDKFLKCLLSLGKKLSVQPIKENKRTQISS